MINLILKKIVFAILFIPALILTITIWLFGGWTQGWDYMPNPVYSLLDWLTKY